MRVSFFIFLACISCKKPDESIYFNFNEDREKLEEEILNRKLQRESDFVEYKDNLENELQGTEAELLKMYIVNDSLLNELYNCQKK